ncbi:MAG: MipA/OmpV family protein, partial [Kiritimatiellia bacterium]
LPSVPDFTRGSGWGLALGLGVEVESAYDGSDEYELELEPAGALQWRSGNQMVYWEGFQLGWRGRLAQDWLVQAGVRYEGGLEPDDSEKGRLDGIAERDSHVAGFLEIRRSIGEEFRNWVGGFVLGGESDFGWLGLLAAGHRCGEALDGTGSEIFVFATFGTDAFFNKDFGVTAADAAASGLEQTELSGGYRSVGLTWVDRRNLTEHLQLVMQAGVEGYSSEIRESPIARDSFEAEVGISLLWRF